MKDKLYQFLIFLIVSSIAMFAIINTIDFVFISIVIFMLGLSIYDLKSSIILMFLAREFLFNSYFYYTGVHSSALTVTIYHSIQLFLLIILVLREKHKFSLDSFRIVLIFFSFYLLVSTLILSDYKHYGIEKLFYYFFILFGCYITMVLITEPKLMSKFFSAIFYQGFLLITLCIISGLSYKLLNGQFFLNRFTVLGLNPIWIGRFLLYGTLVNAYLILKKSNLLIRIFMIILSGFQFYYAFITGSRGPVIAFILGMFAFLLFYLKVKLSRLIVLGLVFSLIVLIGYNQIKDQSSSRFLGGGSGSKSNNSRIIAQFQAYSLFSQNPVTGGGFGSFKQYDLVYPHNIFSEIASETGIIGLLLFLFLLGITSTRIFNLYIYNNNKESALLTALVVTSFINANLSGHIGYNTYFWLSIFVVNHYYLIITKEKSSMNIPIQVKELITS
ncbi:O-antigen ligase family protein [bacterium]|nr:O-antigen ligase family protein [bacterium]